MFIVCGILTVGGMEHTHEMFIGRVSPTVGGTQHILITVHRYWYLTVGGMEHTH